MPLVLLLAAGVGLYMLANHFSISDEQQAVRAELYRAAKAWGLEGSYLDAIGWVESKWRLDAINMAGTDGARGGAHGPTQITARTFLGVGASEADLPRLRTDAAFAAYWTAAILAESNARRPLHTLADYVAAWNAGRDDADRNDDGNLEELGAHVTATTYLPRAKAALELVLANPVPPARLV